MSDCRKKIIVINKAPIPEARVIAFRGTAAEIQVVNITQTLSFVEQFDTSNSFDGTNFVAPRTGIYHFDFVSSISGSEFPTPTGSGLFINLQVNNLPAASTLQNFPVPNAFENVALSTDLLLTGGQIVNIQANPQTAPSTFTLIQNSFSGHFVGPV